MNSNTVRERHHAISLRYKIENFFMQKKIYIPGIWQPNIPKIYIKKFASCLLLHYTSGVCDKGNNSKLSGQK